MFLFLFLVYKKIIAFILLLIAVYYQWNEKKKACEKLTSIAYLLMKKMIDEV